MRGKPSKSKLTFRNSQGAIDDNPTVKATQVKNEFGSILEKATRSGAVAITRHAAPKAVLLSYEEFESLVQVQSRTLENLGAEFDAQGRLVTCNSQLFPKIVVTGVSAASRARMLGSSWTRFARCRVDPKAASRACRKVMLRAAAKNSSSFGFEPGQPPSM